MKGSLLNCRSACKHSVMIKDLIVRQDLDFLWLTETWLIDSSAAILDELSPVGYQLLYVHRAGKRGGGVAVICSTGRQVL